MKVRFCCEIRRKQNKVTPQVDNFSVYGAGVTSPRFWVGVWKPEGVFFGTIRLAVSPPRGTGANYPYPLRSGRLFQAEPGRRVGGVSAVAARADGGGGAGLSRRA